MNKGPKKTSEQFFNDLLKRLYSTKKFIQSSSKRWRRNKAKIAVKEDFLRYCPAKKIPEIFNELLRIANVNKQKFLELEQKQSLRFDRRDYPKLSENINYYAKQF